MRNLVLVRVLSLLLLGTWPWTTTTLSLASPFTAHNAAATSHSISTSVHAAKFRLLQFLDADDGNALMACLADGTEGAVDFAFQPLFDPDTPDDQVPGLVRDVAVLSDSYANVRQAAASMDVTEAVFLCDRITDGPFPDSVKVELLALLLDKFDAALFLPVVAGALVQYDVRGNRIAERFPLRLLTDVDVRGLDLGLCPVRDEIVLSVRIINALSSRTTRTVPWTFTSAAIAHVRRLFPDPFNAVFPFNQFVARHLVPVVAVQPKDRRLDAVRALVRYGLRLDVHDLLQMGLDHNVLAQMLRYARPTRLLFRGDGDVPEDVVDECDVKRPVLTEDDLADLFRYRSYLPTLYASRTFVQGLRRRVAKFQAVLVHLTSCERRQLAAQDFLRYAEFEGVANALVDALVKEVVDLGGDVPCIAALHDLAALPHVHLYAPRLDGTNSLLAVLFRYPKMFEALLSRAELLGRIQSDLESFCQYLRRCPPADTAPIRQFLRRHRQLDGVRPIFKHVRFEFQSACCLCLAL